MDCEACALGSRASIRNASGSLTARVRTYWYAWKGGPPLRGEPGTPEFVHSYNEAIATKAATPQGKLLSVLQAYQASGEFNGLAARTRFDYVGQDQGHRSRVRRFPDIGADRSAHARHLHGVARQARRQVTAAGGLYVVGVRPRPVVGARSRARVGKSVRARRSALSRLACRQDLDRRRRGRLSQIRAGAFPSAAVARAVDRAATGRSVAPAVVGL